MTIDPPRRESRLDPLRSRMEPSERARLLGDLRRLANELATAQDDERRRLARDLHDSIGQTLPALKLAIENGAAACEPGRSEIVGRLSEVIRQVRSLVFELYPTILDDLGLAAALEHHARELALEGLAVAIDERGERRSMSSARQVVVFRAVKELLRNVVKHARATRARVTIVWRGDDLRVTVRDNGSGFDPARALAPGHCPGLGLLDIRERVRHLGGDLVIASRPQGSTAVTLVVPVGGPP